MERPPVTIPAMQLDTVSLTLASKAGSVDILHDVSLTIAAGETIGIVGPSGSGKSSLLMLMGALERVSSGRISAFGQDYGALDEDGLARFRRDKMGIVFQSFHLIPTMTALENVAVPLELAGRGRAFDVAREALAQVGLSARLEHYPSQLSGGEQQRVALARATVPDPAILLADEPTGNLDGSTGSSIIDLLFTLQEKTGSTLVLVTHDETLTARCGRVLRLKDGRVESDTRGTP